MQSNIDKIANDLSSVHLNVVLVHNRFKTLEILIIRNQTPHVNQPSATQQQLPSKNLSTQTYTYSRYLLHTPTNCKNHSLSTYTPKNHMIDHTLPDPPENLMSSPDQWLHTVDPITLCNKNDDFMRTLEFSWALKINNSTKTEFKQFLSSFSQN